MIIGCYCYSYFVSSHQLIAAIAVFGPFKFPSNNSNTLWWRWCVLLNATACENFQTGCYGLLLMMIAIVMTNEILSIESDGRKNTKIDINSMYMQSIECEFTRHTHTKAMQFERKSAKKTDNTFCILLWIPLTAAIKKLSAIFGPFAAIGHLFVVSLNFTILMRWSQYYDAESSAIYCM